MKILLAVDGSEVGLAAVRQLVEFSENDLLNIRNFGAKSIEEVKDKLASMGMSLKQ